MNPIALRRFWAFRENARQDMPNAEGAPGFAPKAISDITQSADSPVAIWARSSWMQTLVRGHLDGRWSLLGHWSEEGGPDDSIFQLVASWPCDRIDQFNFEGFLQRLEEEPN